MEYDMFDHTGIEKAVFFMEEHEDSPPKEILRLFSEQFGEAVDPKEFVMALTVLFNIIPQDFDEVFNRRYAESFARFNASRQGKHLVT
jgi:hypothetical protein